jgi:hypothetical protein
MFGLKYPRDNRFCGAQNVHSLLIDACLKARTCVELIYQIYMRKISRKRKRILTERELATVLL